MLPQNPFKLWACPSSQRPTWESQFSIFRVVRGGLGQSWGGSISHVFLVGKEKERDGPCFHPGPPVLVWFWVECKFSSVTQSCLTLCDPMDCSSPGFPVHHQLPELVQTHVHLVSGAIQSSHPLSPPSPPAFSLSQHEGLFQWVSSSHQVAKVLQLQLQHQSFQWIFRTVSFRIDRFDLLAIQGTLKGLL